MLNVLLKQLQSPEPSTRKQAIIALVKLNDPAALSGLEAVYRGDDDPALRKLALRAGRRIQAQMRLAEPDFLVGVETWGDGLSRRSRHLQIIPSWLRFENIDAAPVDSGLIIDVVLAAVSTLLGCIVFALLALKPLLSAFLAANIQRTDSGFADPVSEYLDTVFTPILSFDSRTMLLLGVTFGVVCLCLMLIHNGSVHFAARMLGTFESYDEMLRHVLASQAFINLIFFVVFTLMVLINPAAAMLPLVGLMAIIGAVAVGNWYSKLYAQAYGFTLARGFAALVLGTGVYAVLYIVGGVILPLL